MPKVRVIDVGAMFLDEAEEVWQPLQRRGHCASVVGFEPCAEETSDRSDQTPRYMAMACFFDITLCPRQPPLGAKRALLEECERLNASVNGLRKDEEGSASAEPSAAVAAAESTAFRFLPWALGDGQTGQFRKCSAAMTSSMLEPTWEGAQLTAAETFRAARGGALAVSPAADGLKVKGQLLGGAGLLVWVTTVVERSEMETRRLDDLLGDIPGKGVDYLKIDVQGFELAVLKGAQKALEETLVLHTEVEFVEMYERQPLFAEVDQFLRQNGFVFHRFSSLHGRPLKPLHFAANPLQPISQQLWADAVYVKDSADPAETHGGAVLGFYSGSGGDCPEAFGRKMKEPMK
ncbi:DNA polymerase delta catalytic subunit [Durusdinium trenchii]|uniref:DNA polymerase delta catalytic subunit n=1 Tax=Durusdinium trenchii TaxID=1381693 RepID=A0ABP0KXB5_9DINO